MTDAELRKLASPVVVETDDAIRSILAHLNSQPFDVTRTVYRMLLMGAAGVLIQAGQPKALIAANLRSYAAMLERNEQ